MNKKKIIAFIPARGGSKGVKLKNLHSLGKKPLLAWPIEAAKKAKVIDRIFVSTDHKKIVNCAKKYGAEIHNRPKKHASDWSTTYDTVKDFYYYMNKNLNYKPDIIIVLEPTSPFRKKGLIDKCLNLLIRKKVDSIATFITSRSHPYRIWKINKFSKPKPYFLKSSDDAWIPRQKLEKTYELDGSIYAFFVNKKFFKTKSLVFGKSLAYFLNRKDNFDLTGTEIDEKYDFKLAEIAIKMNKKKNEKK